MDSRPTGIICNRVHARVGFLGNPSDGFFGKTISFSLGNFYAEVRLQPATTVQFVPHPLYDKQEFAHLSELCKKIETEGYYGGVRLLMAACKKFYDYCTNHGLELKSGGYSLSYDTNIPRQMGLSGSSAIVCAAMNCLMEFYGVTDQVPVHDRPTLVLSAEEDLGITAGLQDRVIQVYGGLVYMDFEEGYMKANKRGRYTPLDPSLLPPLWLMHATDSSDSGHVHSDVKKRWVAGEEGVRRAMRDVANVAEQGRGALERKEPIVIARLMSQNFDLRREMFGDAALGGDNLRMVELARSVGAAGKLTGSGGAVLVLCPQGGQQAEKLRGVCESEGFTLVKVQVGPTLYSDPSS